MSEVRTCRLADGYPVDGRSDLCAAHRKRALRNGGDPLAEIPVRRHPGNDRETAMIIAQAMEEVGRRVRTGNAARRRQQTMARRQT